MICRGCNLGNDYHDRQCPRNLEIVASRIALADSLLRLVEKVASDGNDPQQLVALELLQRARPDRDPAASLALAA